MLELLILTSVGVLFLVLFSVERDYRSAISKNQKLDRLTEAYSEALTEREREALEKEIFRLLEK